MLLGLFAAVTSKVTVESIIGGVTLGTTIYCCSKTGKTSKGKKYKQSTLNLYHTRFPVRKKEFRKKQKEFSRKIETWTGKRGC